MAKGKLKWLKITLGVIAGLVLLVLLVLRIVLSSSFLTKTVNRYAPQFVDGDLSFSKISASVFSSFPSVGLTLEDAVLTYPHDRFARFDSLMIRSRLRSKGRSEAADTLASFRKLHVAVNLPGLAGGKIHIHDITLDGARIFAHQYDSVTANWNIFKAGESDPADTTSSSLPHVIIHRLALGGKPYIVYTSPSDTVFAGLRMKSLDFKGRLDIADLWDHRLDFAMDSLFVHGRLPADTLAMALDHLGLKQRGEQYDVDLAAKAYMATKATGRLKVPVNLSSTVSFPEKDFKDISLRDLAARFATISLKGDADLKLRTDSTYVRAELGIDTCSVDRTINYFAKNFLPKALGLKTDAVITLTALCDGWYKPSDRTLPELIAELVIPESAVAYDGLDYKGNIVADINATTDKYGRLDVVMNKIGVDIAGASVKGSAAAEDVLGPDPLLDLDLKAKASLAKLGYLLPEGMVATGDIDASLSGLIFLSDANLYNFSKSDLKGSVVSREIRLDDSLDTLSAYLGNINLGLDKAGKMGRLGADILGLTGTVDTLYATYGYNTIIKGSKLFLAAQNAETTLSEEFGSEVKPIVGYLRASNLTMTGQDSLFLSIRGTSNSFKYSARKEDQAELPILSVSSRNKGIFLRSGYNRIGLRDASVNASAVKKGAAADAKRIRLLDSLQRVYPGVERDSLLRHHFRVRMATRGIPDYLTEKDFRASDLRINLGETVASYFKEWTLGGGLKVDKGMLVTPYLPLKNRMENIEGSFDNNTLTLSNLTFRSGESDISASGKVTGLQRAVAGRGMINMDLALTSDYLDANQLLAAYDAGTRFVPTGAEASLTDEEYAAQLIDTAVVDTTSSSLIVLPANVNANLSLQGNRIKYSDLEVNWFASDIKLKRRTLQVTNTVATSNMGDIYFEGFYSTRTKKDLTAGFDLNLADITADKVITLFPQVDSIIPMLKTFKGMLDCELAATTQLDTLMNLIPPSINGVMSIKGSDLSIHDDGAFRKIARILMFKDKSIGKIQDMSVQGLISDNVLEVYPFVLGVDRYQLAMSGLQNFDQSFNYHVSVLKSPIPFRFGVDLFGNFDDWDWRLVKARYRDANVPVYTKELNTMQVNLITSIHDIFDRGVEEAVRANEASAGAMSARRADAVGEGLDSASAHALDSLRFAYDHPEEADSLKKAAELDALLNARIESAMNQQEEQPQEKVCWLKRLFTCKKKEARKQDEL